MPKESSSLVGKIVKVLWKDVVMLSVDGELSDVDWDTVSPVLEAFGRVIYDSEDFLVLHPFPLVTGTISKTLSNCPIVIPKHPIETICELVEKKGKN